MTTTRPDPETTGGTPLPRQLRDLEHPPPDEPPARHPDRAPGDPGERPQSARAANGASMDELREKRAELRGTISDDDAATVSRQHDLGKLTARERLDLLLDPDTFTEIEPFRRHTATSFGMAGKRPHTDGVITGSGLVHGRRVFVYAQDFTVFGGSLGAAHADKIHKVMDLAISVGAPVIGLNDGGGARIQEGIRSLAGFGGIFRRIVRASGVVPQISVVLGPCAGGAAYAPALTDFTFMVGGTGQMYLTGPDVVRAVTGEDVTTDELGGARVHGEESGVASFVYDDEETCLDEVRYLVSMLPANNAELPPAVEPEDPADRSVEQLAEIVPADPKQVFDVRGVIEQIVDHGEFFEVHQAWAPNVVCAFARMNGHVTGFVANQPMVQAGVLDIPASDKAARFVRTCDAFNIPLVTLVDVPGFLPGTEQERDGIIRHGAKLLYAYCEATVPRIQLILRKAYGGAYIVMDSRSVGADLSFAWPSNEIAVMGAEGAVEVIHHRELANAENPEQRRAELSEEYAEELAHPYYAAEGGLVDDVIDPAQSRRVLIHGLDMLRSKRDELPLRKHGNQPV